MSRHLIIASTLKMSWGLVSPNTQLLPLTIFACAISPPGIPLFLGEVDSTFSSSSITPSLILEFQSQEPQKVFRSMPHFISKKTEAREGMTLVTQ